MLPKLERLGYIWVAPRAPQCFKIESTSQSLLSRVTVRTQPMLHCIALAAILVVTIS